jgi:hypothetical protein
MGHHGSVDRLSFCALLIRTIAVCRYRSRYARTGSREYVFKAPLRTDSCSFSTEFFATKIPVDPTAPEIPVIKTRLITPTRNADHDQPGTPITFIGIRRNQGSCGNCVNIIPPLRQISLSPAARLDSRSLTEGSDRGNANTELCSRALKKVRTSYFASRSRLPVKSTFNLASGPVTVPKSFP